jgi:putative peptide zinc metalloprotease protein
VLVERDVLGRFVRRGDILGYVARLADPTVRTIVAQDDITDLRGRLASVEVRLAESPREIIPARVEQVVPTATIRLPSRALGAAGGGAIAVDARDSEGLTAAEPFFMVDLELPSDAPISGFGGRVRVRFDYQPEPIFWRAHRSLRRLFMGELGV